jgi:hypothetical protein
MIFDGYFLEPEGFNMHSPECNSGKSKPSPPTPNGVESAAMYFQAQFQFRISQFAIKQLRK